MLPKNQVKIGDKVEKTTQKIESEREKKNQVEIKTSIINNLCLLLFNNFETNRKVFFFL